jgi:hypothetical protein
MSDIKGYDAWLTRTPDDDQPPCPSPDCDCPECTEMMQREIERILSGE